MAPVVELVAEHQPLFLDESSKACGRTDTMKREEEVEEEKKGGGNIMMIHVMSMVTIVEFKIVIWILSDSNDTPAIVR